MISTLTLSFACTGEVAGEDVCDSRDEHQESSRLGWLLETGKPKELEMYEVPYKGPPIL